MHIPTVVSTEGNLIRNKIPRDNSILNFTQIRGPKFKLLYSVRRIFLIFLVKSGAIHPIFFEKGISQRYHPVFCGKIYKAISKRVSVLNFR